MTTRFSDRSPEGNVPVPLHIASGWLEAEIEATSSVATRALLLHEAALLQERAGNVTEAARLQLQAVNTDPQLTEPVERLLALFEQRHSLKNIGRVVERLGQLADTVEERERATVERAAFALIEQRDCSAARTALLELVEAVPTSSIAWNLLNAVAEQTHDLELLQQVIKARVSLSDTVSWTGLLLLELAEIQHELGDFESALASLDQVIETAGPLTLPALDLLESVSFSHRQYEIMSRALVSKASLIERARHDSSIGDALGVPRWRRADSHVADAFLRAAIARHTAGNISEAATLLERALGLLPDDPVLLHSALLCAEERRDFELAVSLAKSFASRSSGDLAGAAWLRATFYELARTDRDAALRATTSGLAAAPRSLALRALELHLLATSQDSAALACALESCSEVLTNDTAKGRYYLAAAEVWARRMRDATSARAALAQAALFGTEPRVVNRVARLLAIELEDPVWYDESTRRLATSTPNCEEQCELWLELARVRLARDQSERFDNALASLSAIDQGTWLARTFEAYRLANLAIPETSNTRASSTSLIPEPVRALSEPDKPLLRLASLTPDADYKRAYIICSIVRDLQHNSLASAIHELTLLTEEDPSDALAVAALGELHYREGARGAATKILCEGAGAIVDPELAGIVAIRGAILAAETGDVPQCRTALEHASSKVPETASLVERWILRRLLPNDAICRRRLLDAATEGNFHERLILERFALELHVHDHAAASAALNQAEPSNSSIGIALALARVLLDSAEHPAAIRTLVSLAPAFESVAAALYARQAYVCHQVQSPEYLDATRVWARMDQTIAPALEYLSAARAASRLDCELDAWEALSQRTEGTTQLHVDLAQSRARLFNGEHLPPLLPANSVENRIFNLEASRPGCDPRRRSFALQEFVPLLDQAESDLAEILIGFNHLAAGHTNEAFESFKVVTEKDPTNAGAWEGLRLTAQLSDKPEWAAEACESLGNIYQNSRVAAELLEEAASIWLDQLQNDARGERALSHSVARDVRRFSAFDRLFRRVRDQNEYRRLLELIDARLVVSEDVDELVKLHWERARVLRTLGDRDAALNALENVTLLEPDHVGALALAAEISIATTRFADAAQYLDRLARLESAPIKQRLMSGLAAADLYDNKLNLPELSVSLLLALDASEMGSTAVRERLARAAARCENWNLAGHILLGLAESRDSSVGRAEAARLALNIFRDKLSSTDRALPAIQRLLAEIPDDAEAIDCVIEQPFSPPHNRELCELARSALRLRLFQEPTDAESIDRLAQIAAILDDAPLRQVTLGALVSLHAGTPEMAEELKVLESRAARLPSIALDEESFSELAEVGDIGPLTELFMHLAAWFAEALGPSLSVLDVTKKQRIDPRVGHPVRNEIAAWAGALGLGEFDVYVGGVDPDNVIGIPTEIPSLVVGTAVRAPLAPQHRQLVARELYAIRRGTSILRHRTPAEIAALVVAVCRVADVKLSAPAYALVDEFSRLLSSVPRRFRKLLPAICSPIAATGADPVDWHAAATSSLDRMAALAAGDLSLVLASPSSRGLSEENESRARRQERLLRFVFSNQYLSLRDRLGVRVK